MELRKKFLLYLFVFTGGAALYASDPNAVLRLSEVVRSNEQQLSRLAKKVDTLEDSCARLGMENKTLQKQLDALASENRRLKAELTQMAQKSAQPMKTPPEASGGTARVEAVNDQRKIPVGSGEFYEYKVQPGATLSAIARAYKVKVSDIREANRLKSNMIRVGQILYIPKKD